MYHASTYGKICRQADARIHSSCFYGNNNVSINQSGELLIPLPPPPRMYLLPRIILITVSEFATSFLIILLVRSRELVNCERRGAVISQRYEQTR